MAQPLGPVFCLSEPNFDLLNTLANIRMHRPAHLSVVVGSIVAPPKEFLTRSLRITGTCVRRLPGEGELLTPIFTKATTFVDFIVDKPPQIKMRSLRMEKAGVAVSHPRIHRINVVDMIREYLPWGNTMLNSLIDGIQFRSGC